MEQEGIKFICNANVGENVEAQLLLRDFDATVICTGATQPRDLPVEGRKLQRRALRDGVPDREHQGAARTAAPTRSPIHAQGKDVVVIGGGDTGTDCVGTAMRQGCSSLTQIEILPRPPVERAADNPWPEWPKVYKLDYGQEEAAAKFGADPRVVPDDRQEVRRRRRTGKLDRHRDGRRCKWERNDKGSSCRSKCRAPSRRVPRSSSCWRWASSGPKQPLLERSRARAATRAATSRPSTASYTTNLKGVFAAGDCRRGQSLVVWAINEGRGAARECDRYLMGRTDLP